MKTNHGAAPQPQPEITTPIKVDGASDVLGERALALVGHLHQRFDGRRLELLAQRRRRQAAIDAGELPGFLPETATIRAGDWRVAPVPADLQDRRVEITGPVDRKMMINALNSRARAFMADFEDSCAPTWENIVRGQVNLRDAVDRSISFQDPATGRSYHLNEHTATLIVRPRGWHLPEKHLRVDGQPVSAALFDFAVFLANNHRALAARGTGPYFYLPKLESHLEARLWNDVFLAAQDWLGMPRGTIKATVLIETILAAFEMDEILWELREHSAGLNCGRWDYIFSFIKKFRNRPGFLLPDRGSITMERHFLKSYVDLLIQTCHRRGAHAMGGMAAQIPIRGDAQANAEAMARVLADKTREARAGHDGTWIAHPGLAEVALEAFDAVMRGPNQVDRLREDVRVEAADLLQLPQGAITDAGLRHNIRVGVQYLEAWLGGLGCVPLYHLMEDAATAEISRAQLWQWIRHGARTDDGQPVTAERFDRALAGELEVIAGEVGAARYAAGHFAAAAKLFGDMIRKPEFDEFLTLPAYDYLP
ncbi:MAG: malate synthase [Gammaproteobacteria bacterium]|nr:malate synthase A [Gammaproteobacteria bacterium]MCE7896472.1 malate synthase A [Gammaproteobacteria bacterium PRO8]MCQ3935148.1 malate synthase A [Gammaproteobacteria bacterium]MDL1880715.1 malate synthase A [Gammaproteobacteria bacterium PRO2]GIK36154.1 MAG: malate synthase [Gammaproteobacteria bacterium]